MSLLFFKRVKCFDASKIRISSFFYYYRIHIAVTLLHTADGMADQLIKDVTNLIADIMKNPKKPVEGDVKNTNAQCIAKEV